jgi:hypothetical protein
MNTATKPETCKDRISQELAEREADIQAMFDKAEESEYYGDEESIYEYALSVDTYKLTKICLSYGGPSDYIEITHDSDSIQKMVYRFSDWFDTATEEIEEGSALWRYGVIMLEGLGE